MKILINKNIDDGLAAYNYRGQIVEATETKLGNYELESGEIVLDSDCQPLVYVQIQNNVPDSVVARAYKGRAFPAYKNGDYYYIVEDTAADGRFNVSPYYVSVVEPIKVKVSEDIPEHCTAHDLAGQTIEVVKDHIHQSYSIVGKSYNIREEYFEVLGQFVPKSGMTFKTRSGEFGLFVETEKGLWMLYSNGTGYTEHGLYTSEYLNPDCVRDAALEKVYSGMNRYPHYGCNEYLENSDKNPIWTVPVRKNVKLNDDYTATIEGNEVVIGCQRISIEKVREVLILHEKLNS